MSSVFIGEGPAACVLLCVRDGEGFEVDVEIVLALESKRDRERAREERDINFYLLLCPQSRCLNERLLLLQVS